MAPVIYVIDLESSPWSAYCYGSMHEPIVIQITDYTQILSMAWRKHGEKKTRYIGQNQLLGYVPGELNDRELVEQICDILKDADYIVGHNGDQFDIKLIRERVMFHRLPPFPDIPTFDTKKMVKTTSHLPSNKLQIVTEFLGNGGKLAHNGTDLFINCMKGDEKAWKINEKYNKQDVDITYQDFLDILPYSKLTSAQQAFGDGIRCKNPQCLSLNLQKSKLRKVVGGYKQQYQCQDCHGYVTATKKQTADIAHLEYCDKI